MPEYQPEGYCLLILSPDLATLFAGMSVCLIIG
jgi:hypothetical protein